jgi:hypothetical protein
MRTFHFYHTTTGEFIGRTFGAIGWTADAHLEANTPEGCAAHEGNDVDWRIHRKCLVTGAILPRETPIVKRETVGVRLKKVRDKIAELERQANGLLRKFIVSPTEEVKQQLKSVDEQIDDLTKQLQVSVKP